MAFTSAEWRRRETQRDPATNAVTGMLVSFELFDDATAGETLKLDLLVQGDPLTQIMAQPDAATRRAALIAYVKPQLKRLYRKWIVDFGNRTVRQPDDVSTDAPITNLG